jgi:hypothetical protein
LVCALFVQTGFVALPVEFLVAAPVTMSFFCAPVRIAWISYGLQDAAYTLRRSLRCQRPTYDGGHSDDQYFPHLGSPSKKAQCEGTLTLGCSSSTLRLKVGSGGFAAFRPLSARCRRPLPCRERLLRELIAVAQL